MGISSPKVYFSFDDGPNIHGDTTERLLDVLKKYQIRALFILLGENVEQYPELVRRMYDEGHYIVNHGYYSGKHAHNMNDEDFRNNLLMGEAAISQALGFEMNPKLYRPHGGFYNFRQEKICVDEGYTMVPVTVRVYDAVINAAGWRRIVNNTVNLIKIQGCGLVLLHDGRDSHSFIETRVKSYPNSSFDRSFIPDAVEKIIIALQNSGFDLSGSDIAELLVNLSALNRSIVKN